MATSFADSPSNNCVTLYLQPEPERRCCSQRHWGPVCLDGLVMCCVCYGRYEPGELFVDSTGTTWDMCEGCGKDIGG